MSGCQQVTSHKFIIAMTWQRRHWIICMTVHGWWSPWFNMCDFFSPNAICHFSAQDFKKPSSQASKQNQIETAVHLNILEPWTMAYHMAVMAAAPHMYCGRGFGLLWEDVSTQTRPLPRLTPKITNGEKRNLRGLVFFGLSRLGLTLTLRLSRSITLAGLGRFWFGTTLTSNRWARPSSLDGPERGEALGCGPEW